MGGEDGWNGCVGGGVGGGVGGDKQRRVLIVTRILSFLFCGRLETALTWGGGGGRGRRRENGKGEEGELREEERSNKQ